MAESLAPQPSGRHLIKFDEVPLVMAKASLNKVEESQARKGFGEILRRAVELAGLIEKEAAEQMGVDRAQFARWLGGQENPQVWRFQRHPLIGPALIAAQAEVTPGATIRTVIELERKVGA